MFASAIETSVKEANPLLQVVSVLSHHPVSHHLLLPNQTLQFVTFEGFQPAGGNNEVFGMNFKISCKTKLGEQVKMAEMVGQSNRLLLVQNTYLRCQCYHKLHTCSSSRSTCPLSSAEGWRASGSGSMYLKSRITVLICSSLSFVTHRVPGGGTLPCCWDFWLSL